MIYKRTEYEAFTKKHFPESEFLLDLEIVSNPPKEYMKDFMEKLVNHERYHEIKNDFVYDEELNIFAQVHHRFHQSEIEDLNAEEVFFYPFMSKPEIRQIFKIRTASDYLLRLRAEQVENNIRLKRTFSKLKKRYGDKWSFTHHFDSDQYKVYLDHLKPKRKKKCLDIPHGTIHSGEANGMCINTPYGNIIVLSYSLRHFLYYMNVFYYGSRLGISQHDVISSFVLAMRIMMGTESLDFELDPRGELPPEISDRIDYMTDWQMDFVIGHEYAHHYLGHLENRSVLRSNNRIHHVSGKVGQYAYEQNCEFEADQHAISETLYAGQEKLELLDGAFLFFSFLDMYEKVENYLYPKTPGQYPRTHPAPLERLWKLREAIDKNIGLKKEQLNTIIDHNNAFMDFFLKEYLPYNVETMEMVGSVYLPGYRKKVLIDRLDF